MRFPKFLVTLGLLAGISTVGDEAQVYAQEQRLFSGSVLERRSLGELAADEYAMKGTLLTMQPGAEIPDHKHTGPGLRYVLEGAITIAWKDGSTQTFSAGSTYFEGPGSNHPSGNISARNGGNTLCRVWIVELVPE